VTEPAPPRAPKVALCIPSAETWQAMMAFATVCLVAESVRAGVIVIPINCRGADAAENRNMMVKLGLEQDADAFLFVDADMTFPADGLVRLLHRRVPIVGADYRNRQPPHRKLGLTVLGEPVADDEPEPVNGMVDRGVIGLGFVLVRRQVFLNLPQPWFARTWIPEHAKPDNPFGFSTDDSYFFHYARLRAGVQVWCDLELTREVCHIGQTLIPWERPKNA
jgi:hypothetical protein